MTYSYDTHSALKRTVQSEEIDAVLNSKIKIRVQSEEIDAVLNSKIKIRVHVPRVLTIDYLSAQHSLIFSTAITF
jgi:hypothetical protein